MSAPPMQTVPSSSSENEPVDLGGPSSQRPPTREKTKRPQLSCNPCRARKVKCDRVQPCTACSLHQIAENCQYDLTEAERQPILQAEALREKDREIALLKRELERLGGRSIKSEYDEGSPAQGRRAPEFVPRVPRKPANLKQKPLYSNPPDTIYFGAPGMANVIEEFANLSIESYPSSLTHTVPRGTDIFAFQMATSHPFPTLWPAQEGVSGLLRLLPPSMEDIFAYLDAFQARASSCSFPHIPQECTRTEIERFLSNKEHNALVHPDMLALLFATLAQGSQNGVFDKCGGRWINEVMEEESKMGDVYIAAAMQALRTASFMNRPSVLAIETLIMIGPYLTNSGKFLDAWALFGITIRLAQSIGLHRDPNLLNPPAPLEEVQVRKNLWWWMLHMDQQYSTTLGRPLGISSMGDCPPPEPTGNDPILQTFSDYIAHFTILARQILSTGYLTNEIIDNYSDQLLELRETLPLPLKFEGAWLILDHQQPPWPMDAQAAALHGKTHNLLILLNRQREENSRKESTVDTLSEFPTDDLISRGRERVLQSCRALLEAFEFVHSRVPAAMICWTMGQQAFNAAMILLISLIETGDARDLHIIQQAYQTFLEMKRLGIHKLAGSAVEKLGEMMKEMDHGELMREKVMGKQGMVLLEDPGLQGFVPGGFSPLNFQMTGSPIPLGNAGTGWAATGAGLLETTERPTEYLPYNPSRRRPRHSITGSSLKPRVPIKKQSLKQQYPSSRQRRHSGLWLNAASPIESSLSMSNIGRPLQTSEQTDLNMEDQPGEERPQLEFDSKLQTEFVSLGMQAQPQDQDLQQSQNPQAQAQQIQPTVYEAMSHMQENRPLVPRSSSYGHIDTSSAFQTLQSAQQPPSYTGNVYTVSSSVTAQEPPHHQPLAFHTDSQPQEFSHHHPISQPQHQHSLSAFSSSFHTPPQQPAHPLSAFDFTFTNEPPSYQQTTSQPMGRSVSEQSHQQHHYQHQLELFSQHQSQHPLSSRAAGKQPEYSTFIQQPQPQAPSQQTQPSFMQQPPPQRTAQQRPQNTFIQFNPIGATQVSENVVYAGVPVSPHTAVPGQQLPHQGNQGTGYNNPSNPPSGSASGSGQYEWLSVNMATSKA